MSNQASALLSRFQVESTPKFSVLSFDANAKPPKEDKGAAAKGGKGAAKGGAKGAKPNASSAANGPAAEGEEDKGRKRVNVLLKNELQVRRKSREQRYDDSASASTNTTQPNNAPYAHLPGSGKVGRRWNLRVEPALQ